MIFAQREFDRTSYLNLIIYVFSIAFEHRRGKAPNYEVEKD